MSGTIWVSLGMTGSAAALIAYFTRADPLVALAKSLPRLDFAERAEDISDAWRRGRASTAGTIEEIPDLKGDYAGTMGAFCLRSPLVTC
jgi:hypothetical protein